MKREQNKDNNLTDLTLAKMYFSCVTDALYNERGDLRSKEFGIDSLYVENNEVVIVWSSLESALKYWTIVTEAVSYTHLTLPTKA